MFIHAVLFEIKKTDVPIYRRDCKIWEKQAHRHAGFLGYKTLIRTNEKDQYASIYRWKTEAQHKKFMKRNHDRLVSLCQCPVKVIGYFNFKTS